MTSPHSLGNKTFALVGKLYDSGCSKRASEIRAYEQKNFCICGLPNRPSRFVCDNWPSGAKLMGPYVAAKKLSQFDPKTFLSTIDGGRKIVAFAKKQTIFSQGESSDAVFYIQKGKVRLAVVSKNGKEATIGILNEGDFFGEGCLTGQPLRLCSAAAMSDCYVMQIDKKSMMEVLHQEHAFSDIFVAYLLTRNIRYEEDLVDQLFNSSEKRLARILLLLAHFGKEGKPEVAVPKISQEALAEMVGTTRSRVSFFMNRFRKLGFIDYHAGDALHVHSSLLNIVLHD
jgi:CRP/FNR family cyclic AMP-dependent transcriptional regulator